MTSWQPDNGSSPHELDHARIGRLNGPAKKVVISFNPKSGATDRMKLVESLRERLTESGLEVIVPTGIEDMLDTCRELRAQGELRVVIAAGGDGTASLLVNQLPADTPIAILPLGTENLLAKYLALNADIDSLVEIIVDGHFVKLDVGKANGKCFLVMASCGFDADVVRRLHSRRSGHIRHLSYARPIVNSIRRYRFPKIRITIDGAEAAEIESKWAFVFNAPRYAMNLPIVEDANTMDGKLDLCTFRGGKIFRGLFYLAAIAMRRHRGWKDCRFQQVTRLKLESDDEVPFQLDGDPGGFLPLEIEVVPSFLKVLVSRKWISNVDSQAANSPVE